MLEANFGDGYSQRSAAGINTRRIAWSLTWENIDNADADEIVMFLDNTFGYTPFYWTAPGDTASRLWVLDGGHSVTTINSLSKTVTAKFKQWFGATPA
jgi:phage-related protein